MQIHRVRGRDLRDALRRAGEQFGEAALFLSHETMPDGEVMVAVADPVRTLVTRREVATAARPHGFDDVERAMLRSGCSKQLVASTMAHVERSGARGAYALDAAAQVLGRLVKVAPGPRVPPRAAGVAVEPSVLAFVGPTGVGKTTTLAKIASRMARMGRRIALVTMDTQRPGAVEQLRAFANAMQAPLDVVSDGGALSKVVARSGACDCVLIDTTGRSPRDTRALAELGAALRLGDLGATLSTYLLLSAAASAAAIEDAKRGFGATRPDAWIVTKLDETRAPAAVLEAAAKDDIGVAFLCDGADVGAHLHRASTDSFADLLLRGRLG